MGKVIQRYDAVCENGWSPMFETDEGDFVSFDDHKQVVSKLADVMCENEKLKELISANKD